VDITERKQAEEALIQARSEAERSAQELQAVFAAVPAAVWIARDPKCDDIAGNAVANQFYEAEEGENVSANASSVRRFFRDGKELSPEELPMQYAATHNIDTGQDEFEVLLPSGKRRCLLGGATPLRDPDGQVSGCVGAFIDISKRKQAEEQLAEARAEAVQHAAELESFFSNMTDGVVLHDAEGNAMISNCAARDILGADPRRSVDERVEQYKICKLDGTAMKPEETASGRALRGETVKELRYKLTSGVRDKIISVSSSPVRAADGTILGATTVFRDVTDQAEYERQKEELFDREHNIARVLQQAIMPQAVPAEILGYRFATKYRPALNEAEVGGDFYDVFELADNKIAVLIGDVVGKGLAAAIRVASARHAIRSYAYIDPWPEMVLTMANEALCRDTGDVSQILTAFFAILDIENGTFTCANAGHEPPIICCSHGDCEEIEIGGMPLGLMLGIAYEQSSRRLDPGDIVVMVTDGITEARAPGIVLFGKERLIEFVRQRRNTTLDEITTGILKAATMHAGGQLQDDAAVVVFSPQAGIVEKIIA